MFKNLYKVDVSLNLIKNGLFPIGNGQVEFTVKSQIKEFSEITLTERGKLNKVHVRVHYTSNISYDIITPLLKETKKILKEYGFEYKDDLYESEIIEDTEDNEVENKTKLNNKISLEFSENKIFFNKGYTYSIEIILFYENIIIYLEEKESDKKEILKASLLDLKRKILTNFEDVLINENICLDEYTLDHLIIYMALATGKSTIRTHKLSLHSETALYVASQFLNITYEVKELENNGIELTIQRKN